MQESTDQMLTEHLNHLKRLSLKYYTQEIFDKDFNDLVNFAKKEIIENGYVEPVVNTIVYDGDTVKSLMKFPDLPSTSNERQKTFYEMGEELAHSAEHLFSVMCIFEAWVKVFPTGVEQPDWAIQDPEGRQEALCISGLTLDGRSLFHIYTVVREIPEDENSPILKLELRVDDVNCCKTDHLSTNLIRGFLKVIFVNRFSDHG